MRKCLYVGSFDPFHNGHLNMVKKLCEDYDHVYVMIVRNYLKKPRIFNDKDMRNAMNEVFKNRNLNAECIDVSRYASSSLMAKKLGCECICRGLYKEEDKRFENLVKKYHEMTGVKTIIYPNEVTTSSTLVRKIFFADNDVSSLVPEEINRLLEQYSQKHDIIAKKIKMREKDCAK